MIISIVIFVVSLTVLLIASDKFIEAAERIGLSFGISPFIVGVTIVAFGTSIPELATSIASIYADSSEIIPGTIIGSNITNILLVLGLTAVVGKGIKLEFDIMDIDMPLLLMSAFFLYFTLSDFHFSLFEASLFLIALVAFLLNSIRGNTSELKEGNRSGLKEYITLVVCGVLIWLGAEYVIESIKDISGTLGISKDVIALSGVALGTSLPEVIVSLAAVRRGKNAIAVGNVLGSNIFNTYAVMGISSFFGNISITQDIVDFSLPFMLVVTIIFAVVTLSKKISAWEGSMLLIFYVYYIAQLFGNSL